MKKAKIALLLVVLATVLMALFMNVSAAEDPDIISIDSVTVTSYEGASGQTDTKLVNVNVVYTAVDTEQVSLLLMSENLTDLTENDLSKVIYIDQVEKTTPSTVTFVVEKSRIASATGLANTEGATLYLKMGGLNLDAMATKTITYNDPDGITVTPGDVDGNDKVNNKDASLLMRYIVNPSSSTGVLANMDYDGNGKINNKDYTLLMRYLAA